MTINSRGAARLTKGRPSLYADEISMQLNMELPDALFRKPRLEASIKIPEEAVQTEVINSDVTDNISEAIKSSTGLDVVIRIVNPEEDEETK